MAFYERPPGAPAPVSETRRAVLPERLGAIPEEKLTDAQKKAGAAIAEGPRGSVRGPFVAMLRSPKMVECMQRLGAFIRFECELDDRVNVLAGLIVARYWTMIMNVARTPLRDGTAPKLAAMPQQFRAIV